MNYLSASQDLDLTIHPINQSAEPNIQTKTDIDIQSLIDVIAPRIREPLLAHPEIGDLLEVVIDLGRQPEARFPNYNYLLDINEITANDIDYSIKKIGSFGIDNRAGIERTLHRISAIRNRSGKVIGITFRVGRAVYGTIRIIEDLIKSGQSVLLLGRPGVGKTTMLREVARVLADDAMKRVIVVDTSNEIAGDGDIPHRAIGRARRMQVPSPTEQHGVMIEAVENHMPEVIIIDEIGTEREANAARTIAERGVQLVATAHGNTLENLIMNPTLSDLVGGIQTVTLGDLEAKRRRTQKTILERNAPPTFDVLVEIQSWSVVSVHKNVAKTVDTILRKQTTQSETRRIEASGEIRQELSDNETAVNVHDDGDKKPFVESIDEDGDQVNITNPTKILSYGVNRGRIDQAIKSIRASVTLVNDMENADLVVTTKNYHRRGTQALKTAERLEKPVFVLRRNTANQIEQFVRAIDKERIQGSRTQRDRSLALLEAEKAILKIKQNGEQVELSPTNSYLRRIQHQLAQDNQIQSSSVGKDPQRRVVLHNS